LEVLSNLPEDTLRLGDVIGGIVAPGDVVFLEGELGTGKTVVARGIARGRGHRGVVPSPTFLIIHPYQSIGLCHVDAFRLGGPEELIDAGIEEYLDGDWICAVEWAGRVRAALPPGALTVRLEFAEDENQRRITLGGGGEWKKRLERVRTEFERDAG